VLSVDLTGKGFRLCRIAFDPNSNLPSTSVAFGIRHDIAPSKKDCAYGSAHAGAHIDIGGRVVGAAPDIKDVKNRIQKSADPSGMQFRIGLGMDIRSV
jgi:hypothetical protein